jgi:hypothetical protein
MTSLEQLPADALPMQQNGSSRDDPAALVEAPVRECALDGCDQAVTATGAKYCTPAHQRRAGRKRSNSADAPGPVLPQDPGLSRDGLLIADPPPAGVWLALAQVAASVPQGWRLEVTSSSAHLIWATPPAATLFTTPPGREA